MHWLLVWHRLQKCERGNKLPFPLDASFRFDSGIATSWSPSNRDLQDSTKRLLKTTKLAVSYGAKRKCSIISLGTAVSSTRAGWKVQRRAASRAAAARRQL